MKKRGKFRYKAKPTLEFLMACSLVAIVVIIAISILSYVGVLDREIIKQQKIEDALSDGNAPLLKKISVGISAVTGAVVGATGYIASNPILALLLIFTSISVGVKAQASMEFLMAYGWAIMVLLIAIGTLAYFGVLSPARFMPQKCTLEAGVACTDSEVNEDSVTFVLENVKGEGISISEIAVSNCTGTNFGSFFLKNGDKGTFTVSGCNNIANEKFVEEINITYIGESGLTHKKGGSMVGIVKGGTGAPPSELGTAECGDGDDNDGDGQVDLSDTGCSEPNDDDETDCGDGVCEGGETPASCSADCATGWAIAFGGAQNERIYSIEEVSDGYVAAGMTDSYGAGSDDVLLMKIDSDGNPVWANTFGGLDYDYLKSIQQTSDGGYVSGGYTASFGAGNSDALVMKLDSSGNEVWATVFGGAQNDQIQSTDLTSDGGYIGAGYTRSYGAGSNDALVAKLDSDGSLAWAKTFGGGSSDTAMSIQQTSDGGYIVSGNTNSYNPGGSTDAIILKLDSNGNEVWAKTFGGNLYDEAWSIQQTSDGGYIAAGRTFSYGAGNSDLLVLKLDSGGNEMWSKTFGGSNAENNYDGDRFIKQTSDGGYIISVYTRSYGAGINDALILKLDSDGNEIWAKVFGDTGDEPVYHVQQTSDGGYVIGGVSNSYGAGNSDALVMKLDSSGNSGTCSPLQDISLSTSSPILVTSSPAPTSSLITPITSSPILTTTSQALARATICPE